MHHQKADELSQQLPFIPREVWLHFKSILGLGVCFFYVSKHVLIYVSATCDAVLLWSSRNVLGTTKFRLTLCRRVGRCGWADSDRIFLSGWTVPLNFSSNGLQEAPECSTLAPFHTMLNSQGITLLEVVLDPYHPPGQVSLKVLIESFRFFFLSNNCFHQLTEIHGHLSECAAVY